ncbi:AraC family transcriptional regulator [Ruminococcaceae bacterium OttesenSCG-928-L11]|nr:AraC family transcriptional regulator [Ruminococcaceae bacterium OttesenSCG-928-L11]
MVTDRGQPYRETHNSHGDASFNFALYEYAESADVVFFPMHWHDEYEIIYMESGCMEFELEGRRIRLEENQAIFVDACQIHACYEKVPPGCRYYCIVFGEAFVFPSPGARIYQEILHPSGSDRLKPQERIAGTAPWEQPVLEAIRNTYRAALGREPGYELEVQIHLLTVFLALFRNGAYTQVTSSQESYKGRIREALSFIHENYDMDLSVSALADSMNICTEHFIRSFKSVTGKTPKNYLIHTRINAAAALLATQSASVSAIAEQCGFTDMSYFAKCFHRILGCSPTEYRSRTLRAARPHEDAVRCGHGTSPGLPNAPEH